MLQVDEHPELREGGKVIWRIQYLPAALSAGDEPKEARRKTRRKIITQLNLQKDDTQIVLPMAKTTDLVNTAMLTGAQVTEPLRVFMVTQSGDVADVTLKSSCKSTDESVLKVSSSCTSVYLDGSEARGSQNATVIVNYGSYHGSASFRVWVPEEPLDIEIPDPKLSQIRGWEVRLPETNKHPNDLGSLFAVTETYQSGGGGQICELRYQQTEIEVYAKFVSRDDNSGRVSYVAGRKTSLRVTDLVRGHLRVADPQFATLRGNLLVGKAQGRTKVQLLSPITGAEVASREFRVAADRVAVSALEAGVISGLQLTVSRRADNEYAAVTSVTSRLTAQYQEGLLDMTLLFSDGTRTPLSAVDASAYYLDVETLAPRVVALAPQSSQQPRVLAIGPGKGKLLRITLETDEQCRGPRREALTTTYAHVEVQFAGQLLAEGIQNDASHLLDRPELYEGGTRRHGLQQVLEDVRKAGKRPLSPATELQQRHAVHGLQPLEIGMFILLAVFCVVIAIFIAACFVYAGQVKRANKEGGAAGRQSHADAQDWVWLGRSSLEHVATRSSGSHNQLAVSDMNANVDRFPPATRDLHITVNPQQAAAAEQPRTQQPRQPQQKPQQKPQPQPPQSQQQLQRKERNKQKVDSRTFVKKKHEQPLYQNVSCLYSEDTEGPEEEEEDEEHASSAPPVPPHQAAIEAPPGGRQAAPFIRPAARQPAVRRAN
ncbi:transmembrane protein 132C-like, partial [Pollicipes pollicipes]